MDTGKVDDLIKALPGVEKLFSPQELDKAATQFFKDPAKFRNDMSIWAMLTGLQTLHSGEPVPQEIQDAILNPSDRKEFDERQAAFDVARLRQAIQDPEISPKIKDMNRAQLIQLAPGISKAGDEHITQLIDAGFTNLSE